MPLNVFLRAHFLKESCFWHWSRQMLPLQFSFDISVLIYQYSRFLEQSSDETALNDCRIDERYKTILCLIYFACMKTAICDLFMGGTLIFVYILLILTLKKAPFTCTLRIVCILSVHSLQQFLQRGLCTNESFFCTLNLCQKIASYSGCSLFAFKDV